MSVELKSARSIFLAAVDGPPGEARTQYIQSACDGDESLRREVLRLLGAYGNLNSFMEHPAAGPAPTIDHAPPEQVGATIGRYKLLEQIGEGGMGVVYVAEQSEPVRRRVALKIIKPGMDTRQVIARFEAERQALALMDHPNIAKIFDAGTVGQAMPDANVENVGQAVPDKNVGQAVPDKLVVRQPVPDANTNDYTGQSSNASRQAQPDLRWHRPYFVMELVRGMPITEYCDQAQVDIRGRLELFMTVCHAVQHAHQKGVIHRDIKPSNVLVTLHDGQPVVKVIDFGIAKAISGQLTERTIYTAFTELIGTPLYMSPEQAELSGLDVDTRSDVYSLGVLLYELLTGHTPFDRETVVKSGLDEVRRMIREDEPPRPSHRISTLKADAGSTVSQRRGIDQRQLTRALSGELDWIVMKALEKDRNRRYESASAFAADVGRYLNDEPVEAGPPSNLYRFRKFVRRRRGTLAAVSIVATSLIAGFAISLWQAIEANTARELAHRRAAEERVARRRAESNLRRGNEAVEILLSRVAEEQLLDQPGLDGLRVTLLNDALRINSNFLDENSEDREAKFEAAKAYRRMAEILGNWDYHKSAEASRKAIALVEGLINGHRDELRCRQELANAYRQLSTNLFNGAPGGEDHEAIHRKSLSLQENVLASSPDDPKLLQRVSQACDIVGFAIQASNPEESQELLRRSLAIGIELVERHPDRLDFRVDVARTHSFVGRISLNSGKHQEAKQEFQAALSALTDGLSESPRSASFRSERISALTSLARACAITSDQRSLTYAQQACSAAEQLVGDYPADSGYVHMLFRAQMELANSLEMAKDFDQARLARKRCVEVVTGLWKDFPNNSIWGVDLGRARMLMADNFRDQGELDTAMGEYESAAEVLQDVVKRWPDCAPYRNALCIILVRQAMCHDLLGDFHDGTIHYEKAAALDPSDEWTRDVCMRQIFSLADDLWIKGQQDEARSVWAAAVERARVSFDSIPSDLVRFNLGVAHYRLGNFEESLRHFQESMEFRRHTKPIADPGHDSNGSHFYFIAMNYASLGQHNEAQTWFERGLKWDEQHAATRERNDWEPKRALRDEVAELLVTPVVAAE